MDRIHDIDKLLQTGIEMMVASGYHNTSINEVIRKAGLPKGSFYYLYKDKKAFALAAIRSYGDVLAEAMDRIFADPSFGPMEAVKQYYLQSIASLESTSYSRGCFIGNMGQEMSDVDEDFRELVQKIFARLNEKLSKQLNKAQHAGELSKSANTDVLAEIVENTWHGSLIHMKASKSSKPLDVFINDFFTLLMCNA